MASLRDFVRNVIVNEFAGPEPSPTVLDAIVVYLRHRFSAEPGLLRRPADTKPAFPNSAVKRCLPSHFLTIKP
jgi:hypothetical protein